jgi:hypothetical protein
MEIIFAFFAIFVLALLVSSMWEKHQQTKITLEAIKAGLVQTVVEVPDSDAYGYGKLTYEVIWTKPES